MIRGTRPGVAGCGGPGPAARALARISGQRTHPVLRQERWPAASRSVRWTPAAAPCLTRSSTGVPWYSCGGKPGSLAVSPSAWRRSRCASSRCQPARGSAGEMRRTGHGTVVRRPPGAGGSLRPGSDLSWSCHSVW